MDEDTYVRGTYLVLKIEFWKSFVIRAGKMTACRVIESSFVYRINMQFLPLIFILILSTVARPVTFFQHFFFASGIFVTFLFFLICFISI